MSALPRKPCEADQASQDADRERDILEHLPQVRRVAKLVAAMVPSLIPVEDIVSTGVLGLIRAIDTFPPLSAADLDTCAGDAIQQEIMERITNEVEAVAAHSVVAERVGPEAKFEKEELMDALSDGLHRLPAEVKAVLNMHFAGGLRLHEIAEIMRLHPSRITQLRNAGLHALRVFLEHRGLGQGSHPPLHASEEKDFR